jgi:hypothetical protein
MSEILSMPTSMPIPQQSETAMLIHMYERVIRDPSVDLERVQRVREMLREERALAAQTAYKAALAELQGDLGAVLKRGRIDIGRGKPQSFASLDDIMDVVREPMHRHGFSFEFQNAYPAEKVMEITTILNHRDGHSTRNTRRLPFDTTGSKNPVQSHGSTETYGRRYGILSALNIATTDSDDDGRGAGNGKQDTSPVTIEQLGRIQQALVHNGVPIEWLLEFLPKRGVKAERLEDIPAIKCDSVIKAIEARAAQDERPVAVNSGE